MQEIRVKRKVKREKRTINEIDDDGNGKENLMLVDTNKNAISNNDPGPALKSQITIPEEIEKVIEEMKVIITSKAAYQIDARRLNEKTRQVTETIKHIMEQDTPPKQIICYMQVACG